MFYTIHKITAHPVVDFAAEEQAIERYYDHYVANYAMRKIVNNTY